VAVVEVLLGRDSGWSAQHRQGVALSRKQAWRAHGVHVALGLCGALGAFFLSKYFLIWTSPVFLSLTLSALLSIRTSKPRGAGSLRERLFQTPEDREPPRVLVRANALRDAYAAETTTRWKIAALMKAPIAAYDVGRNVTLPREPAASPKVEVEVEVEVEVAVAA
jgi:membrane glycosyltransferase